MSDTLSEINGMNNFNSSSNYFKNYNPSESLYPELGSPSVGPFISPLPNKEFLRNNKMYTTMTCYNCLSVLLIRKDWIFTRCGECQKVNRIPREQITENIDNFSYYQEDNDLIGDIPYVYGLVICPFCTTENRIRKEAKRVTCYKCGNSFSVNGYKNDKIQKISNSYNRKYPYSFIKNNEYIPVYLFNECNCKQNSQMELLNKILETIKDNKKPTIAYPIIFNDPFGFKYRELLDEGNSNKRYDNYRDYKCNNMNFQISKNKKDNDDNGFRITIRKKNGNKNKNIGNKMTKSAVFEKVFFTNKINEDNKNKIWDN